MNVSTLPSTGCGEPGDSPEQRAAEKFLVAALSAALGVTLTKKKFDLPGGGCVEVDGFSQSPAFLCEAWAHLGPPKPAQRNKVLSDALKLLYVDQIFQMSSRKILLFADNAAAKPFKGRSWAAQALRQFQVEINSIELPDGLRKSVTTAQKRQYR